MWHRELDAWETTYPGLDRLAALRGVVSSGSGSQTRARQLLADRFGLLESDVTLTYSGTAAIDLALRRGGVTSGDEVVLPDYVCPTVAAAVQNVGCRPVVVDVTWPSLTIDVDKIDAAVNSETAAIVVPHVNGRRANVEKIADRWDDLLVIEDAAQGLACSLPVGDDGPHGDVMVLSFSNKHIGVGKGGALIDTSSHGDSGLSSPTLHQEVAATKVNSDSFGLTALASISYVLTDAGNGFGKHLARVPSVLLPEQVAQIDLLLDRRRHHVETYESVLRRGIDAENDIEFLTSSSDAGVPLQFQLAVPPEDREDLLARLEEHDVYAAPGWTCVSKWIPGDGLRTDGPRVNCERAGESVLGLPLPPGATTEQVEWAGREVLRWVRSR